MEKGKKMIKEYFEEVLKYYDSVRKRGDFSGQTADIIRIKLPKVIRESANLSLTYLYEGSVGRGNIAEVPWVRIYEEEVSPSAQEEYYIVYLFDAKMGGFIY